MEDIRFHPSRAFPPRHADRARETVVPPTVSLATFFHEETRA